MRKLLCTVMAFLCFASTWAQRSISGRVTDEKGAPIPNVSVLVKGTQTGTVTAADGSYTLSVPAEAEILVFSSVGMTTQEVRIPSSGNLPVSLQTANSAALDEVVVIGYGTQRRRAVTSAIGRVDGDALADIPLPSVDKQLAGKAAGINITLGTGLANAEPRIRIRGVNSISLSRDPLVVIDGVPTYGPREGGLSNTTNTNPLTDINPADIESVEILKDGAAAAIYGSRAAGGVILITTKKGSAGRANVSYDGYYGSSRAFRKPKLLNAQDFVTINNEKLANANLPAAAFLNAERTDTDWLDAVFRDNANSQSHTLSVSGGNGTTNYYLSANYLRMDGIVQTNTAESYRIRTNLEHRVNKFFKVGTYLTLSRTTDNDQNNGGNALSGAMAAALRSHPNVRIYNPSHPTGYNITPSNAALGQDSNRRVIENNYVNIKYVLDNNRFRSDKYRIVANAFAEITPISGLSIRTQGSVDYQNGTDFSYLNAIHGDGRGSSGSVTNQIFQRRRLVWQNFANYNKSFSDHNLGITVGTEMQRDQNTSFFAQGTNLIDPFFAQNNVLSNTFVNQFSGGGLSRFGFQSFFGRLSYDFGNKYFFQASLRRDGQTSLAPDRRYGTFPGASIGWRVSEEKFWANSGLDKGISEFKIRASYAKVGNILGGGFPYLTTYGVAPYGSVGGVAINQVGNPSLQWESSTKYNVGADFTLFNRFNLAMDFFVTENDDLIFAAPTPPSVGIPGNSITTNIASMRNSGFEFSVLGDIYRKGNFSWNVNFNFTIQRNEITSLRDTITEQIVAGPNNGTFNILRVGEPINAMYGYQFAGVNSGNGNPMWIKANGQLVQYNVVPGAAAGYYGVIKEDDPALGPASTLVGADRKLLGSPIPRYFGGFTNSFNYKGFGLEFMFRFQGGNEVYNLTRQEVLLSQGFVNNGSEILNRWTPTNRNTNVPKLYYGRDNVINNGGLGDSRFVEDGDFVRLQNVQVSYNFNRSTLSRLTNGYIKSARLYVQGQNLAIWTKYTGIDPENTSELGIDNASVPQLRTVTVGLNVGF